MLDIVAPIAVSAEGESQHKSKINLIYLPEAEIHGPIENSSTEDELKISKTYNIYNMIFFIPLISIVGKKLFGYRLSSKYLICVQQKKEIHTGLEQCEGEYFMQVRDGSFKQNFHFWENPRVYHMLSMFPLTFFSLHSPS